MSQTSDARRQQILHAIRGAEDPIGVAELAARLGFHPNTARFHLDALERAGEIERAPMLAKDRASRRGRPSLRYRAVPGGTDPRANRRYELLTEILTSALSQSEHGPALAAEAGYAWGHAQARDRLDASGGQPNVLIALLTEAGFAPRPVDDDAMEFHHCPFREAATRHGEIVCGIHAGLMRGALAAQRGGSGSDSAPAEELSTLEPFVSPGVCRARFAFAS